jgi:hypothetical protein
MSVTGEKGESKSRATVKAPNSHQLGLSMMDRARLDAYLGQGSVSPMLKAAREWTERN